MIIHANTPEEFRYELLEWLKTKHIDATARSRVPNQARHIRSTWIIRANVITEAAAFIKGLKIEPKRPSAFDTLPDDYEALHG